MRFSLFCKLSCILLLSCASFTACKPKLLPNTSVPDTSFNRKVIEFMNLYGQAMEKRSTAELMGLVSRNYADKSASIETGDALNYDQLEEKLNKYFSMLLDLKLKLYVQNIQEKNGQILVTYHFSQNVVVKMPSGEQKANMSDFNRMILVATPKDSKYNYEIVAGL